MKKRKRSFEGALKRAIRRKLELGVPKSDLRLEEDPFLLLGYGMNSYFQVMVELMIMVGLISLVTIPLMGTFASFDALESYPNFSMNKYTLGNIGGADAFCQQSSFDLAASAFNIECKGGAVINMDAIAQNTNKPIFDAGIISADADVNTYCSRTAFTDSQSCSDYLDMDLLTSELNACNGKAECKITNLKRLAPEPAGLSDSPCFDQQAQMFV